MPESAVVAILGTRYRDFSVEEEVLAPIGAELRSGPGRNHDDIVAVAGGADIILAGSGPRFDARTIAALSCQAIVRYGVGTENIDLEAARAHGLWIARVADYGTEAVATHAVAMALAALRRLREADQRVRDGRWEFASLRPLHLPSASVAGIIGFGRIGRHAASQLCGLGFSVLAHDPIVQIESDHPFVTGVDLEELLRRSDVISLHMPGDPSGKPFFDADLMPRLKDGSILVNTSRGSLIDPVALRAGLRAGKPAFAALDVFPVEPTDPTLFSGVEDAVLLSPHMAWYTEESEHDLRVKAATEALRVLKGERPLEVVVEAPAGVRSKP